MKKLVFLLLLLAQFATAQSPRRSGIASVVYDPLEPFNAVFLPEITVLAKNEAAPPVPAPAEAQKKIQVSQVKNARKTDLKNTPLHMSEYLYLMVETPIRDRYQTTYVSESPVSRLLNRK